MGKLTEEQGKLIADEVASFSEYLKDRYGEDVGFCFMLGMNTDIEEGGNSAVIAQANGEQYLQMVDSLYMQIPDIFEIVLSHRLAQQILDNE